MPGQAAGEYFTTSCGRIAWKTEMYAGDVKFTRSNCRIFLHFARCSVFQDLLSAELIRYFINILIRYGFCIILIIINNYFLKIKKRWRDLPSVDENSGELI